MPALACTGVPTFDYTSTQTWPIFGATIEFATHDFPDKTLLVQANDGSYVIVQNISVFNAIAATESNILFLIATNPTTC